MSEWNVHRNPSERFPAFMMSPLLQEQTDLKVANERLKEFLPEGCRSCVRALAFKVKDVAYRVVKDEMSKETAIEEITKYGDGCPGGTKDDYGFIVGCPSQERAEQEM